MTFIYHVKISWVILLRTSTWSTLKTAVFRFGSLPTWNSNYAVMHSFWIKSNTNWLVIVAAKCHRVQSTRSRLKFQCRGITSRRRVDRGVLVLFRKIDISRSALTYRLYLFTICIFARLTKVVTALHVSTLRVKIGEYRIKLGRVRCGLGFYRYARSHTHSLTRTAY